MRTAYCPSKKRGYSTKKAAKHSAKHSANLARKKLYPYRCPWCGV